MAMLVGGQGIWSPSPWPCCHSFACIMTTFPRVNWRAGNLSITLKWTDFQPHFTIYIPKQNWAVVWNIFYFHPYLGKWSNLTNIFQMGWNRQLENLLGIKSVGVESPILITSFQFWSSPKCGSKWRNMYWGFGQLCQGKAEHSAKVGGLVQHDRLDLMVVCLKMRNHPSKLMGN